MFSLSKKGMCFFLILFLLNVLSCKSLEKRQGENTNSGIKDDSSTSAARGSCDFIVISDLDDTIKISHSTSSLSTLGHGLFDNDIYAGMNALFSVFFKCKQQDTNLFIVSASPQFLDDKVNKLLKKHHFPDARVILKDWTGDSDTYAFKVKTITDIMNATTSPVILLGDDTSKDPLVYTEIKKRFGNRVLDVYIHRITEGATVPSDLNLFYTSFDIALNEVKKGRMGEPDLMGIAGLIIDSDDLDAVIPDFGLCPNPMPDCRQFNGSANLASACQAMVRKIAEACAEIDD